MRDVAFLAIWLLVLSMASAAFGECHGDGITGAGSVAKVRRCLQNCPVTVDPQCTCVGVSVQNPCVAKCQALEVNYPGLCLSEPLCQLAASLCGVPADE